MNAVGLLLIAAAIATCLPFARKGHSLCRIAVVLLSIVLVLGAVHRIVFQPTAFEKRNEMMLKHFRISGQYAGENITARHPGETVTVMYTSISPSGPMLSDTDHAFVEGMRKKIEKKGGALEFATVNQQPLPLELLSGDPEDFPLPTFTLDEATPGTAEAAVLVSLVGVPDPGITETLFPDNPPAYILAVNHPFPQSLARALARELTDAAISMRKETDWAQKPKRGSLEEKFEQCFLWITPNDQSLLKSLF